MEAPNEEPVVARSEAVARFVADWARVTGAEYRPPDTGPAAPIADSPDDPGHRRVRLAAERATVAYPGVVGN